MKESCIENKVLTVSCPICSKVLFKGNSRNASDHNIICNKCRTKLYVRQRQEEILIKLQNENWI